MTLPAVGKAAPAFSAFNQDGEKISLKDFKGTKVALYFYPQDNTPTCTTQACNLRDNFALLKKHGIQVIGVSPDNVKSHKKFEEKFKLPFPLVADEGSVIAEKYGVWGPKKFMGREYIGLHRTTFAIDENGKLKAIIEKPVSKDHAREILEAFGISVG